METEPSLQEANIPAILAEIFGERNHEAAEEMLIAALEILAEEAGEEIVAKSAEKARRGIRLLCRKLDVPKDVAFARLWGASVRTLIGLGALAAAEGIRMETN